MTKQSHFIAQITEEEAKAKTMLEKTQEENDKRIAAANDQARQLVQKTEEAAREIAMKKIGQAKEKAKEEYKRIMVDEDNARRDVIENGKKNLPKAEKIITDTFVGLFK